MITDYTLIYDINNKIYKNRPFLKGNYSKTQFLLLIAVCTVQLMRLRLGLKTFDPFYAFSSKNSTLTEVVCLALFNGII